MQRRRRLRKTAVKFLNMRIKGVKFSWFTGKSLKSLVTRCQILRLKCTKVDFRKGFASDSSWVCGWGGDLKRFLDQIAVW